MSSFRGTSNTAHEILGNTPLVFMAISKSMVYLFVLIASKSHQKSLYYHGKEDAFMFLVGIVGERPWSLSQSPGKGRKEVQ